MNGVVGNSNIKFIDNEFFKLYNEMMPESKGHQGAKYLFDPHSPNSQVLTAWEIKMNTLGERLYYVRRKRGYTQESLAGAIGVSRGVIYNLEKNKTTPQIIVIHAICQILHINEEWLSEDSGCMEEAEISQSARILNELYEVAGTLSEQEQRDLLDTAKALKPLPDNKSNTP